MTLGTFYENRCNKCNSFVPSKGETIIFSEPSEHKLEDIIEIKEGHSGYCKTFSFINKKWVGSVMSKKFVQSQCPYNLVLEVKKDV